MLRSATILLLIVLSVFFGLYENYPRPGWVDPSLYTGYAINPDIYKIYPFQLNAYHGSRLGYIFPLHLFSQAFGDLHGRALYVLSLYLAYSVSVLIVVGFFLKKEIERILVCTILLFNPVFISSILYGGVDGPASVQFIVSIALLIGATHSNRSLTKILLSFLSGIFLALSLSSHVFMLIPALLVIPGLVFLYRISKLLVVMAFGAAITITLCALVGLQFGIEQFYFLYSVGWAKKSLGGSGSDFSQPFYFWIKNSIFWLPVILSILLCLGIRRDIKAQNRKQITLWILSLLNLVGPATLYIIFDVFIGGNLLGTPSYFNIVFPSFFIGFVILIALSARYGGEYVLREVQWTYSIRGVLILFIALNVSFALFNDYVKPMFSYNSVNTREFYQSQVAFRDEIKASGLNGKKIQFVYKSANAIKGFSPRIYKDYFRGSPRFFDYFDSLVALFVWDQSIAARIDPASDLSSIQLTLKGDRPVILLGSSKTEIQQMNQALSRLLVGYSTINAQCYDENSYPWCFLALKYDENSL